MSGLPSIRNYLFMTIDPVHVGTGSDRLGYVDLPIVREPGTNVPKIPGTSLSGGALPLADGVLLGMGKFNKVLDIDYANRAVVAQPELKTEARMSPIKARGVLVMGSLRGAFSGRAGSRPIRESAPSAEASGPGFGAVPRPEPWAKENRRRS